MAGEDINFRIGISADTGTAESAVDELGGAADDARRKLEGIEERGLEVKGSVEIDDAAAKKAIADLEGRTVKVKVEPEAARASGRQGGAAAANGAAGATPAAVPSAPAPKAEPVAANGGVSAQTAQNIKLTEFGEMPRNTMQRIAGGVDNIAVGVDALEAAARDSAQGEASGAREAASAVSAADGGEGAGGAAAEVDKGGIKKAYDDLQAAVKSLDDAAAQYGTEAGERVRKALADISATIEQTGGDNLEESFKGITRWLQEIVDEGNKLPPDGLEAMGGKIVGLVESAREFARAMRSVTDVKFDVDLSGIDGLDVIEDKLEVIKNARGLGDGIKELEQALLALDPKKAAAFAEELLRVRELLSKKLDSGNLAEIDAILASIERRTGSLDAGEFEKIAPKVAGLRLSFGGLRDSVQGIGAELRDEFDAGSFASSVLSGNIEGVTKGLIGIAAGAKVAGAALRSLLASTIVGAIVAAVAAVAALFAKWVKHVRDAGFEASKMRFERAQGDLEASSGRLERTIRLLDIEKGRVDAVTERYKAQIDVVQGLADAQARLAETRELANAKTEREREDIRARYESAQTSREAESGIKKAAADYVQMQNDVDVDRKKQGEKENQLRAKRQGDVDMVGAYQWSRGIAGMYGLGVWERPDAQQANVYTFDQMAAQYAYNKGMSSVGTGFSELPVSAQNLGIPQEVVEEWRKNIRIDKVIGGEALHAKTWSGWLPGDAEGVAEALKSQYAEMIKNQHEIAELQASLDKDREELAYREGEGLDNLRKALDAAVAEGTKKLLADANAVTKAREDFANSQTVTRREFGRSREDAYAYDNERAGLTERRLRETEGFMDAYMNGGTDEYGRKIDVGINGIREDEERYRKMVEDTAEMRKAAALRDAGGAERMSEAELGLAARWDELKGAVDEMERRVRDNAAKLPGLISGFEAQQRAANQLVLAMDALAMSYREEARNARLEDANRRRSREDAERARVYNQQGRGTRLEEDRRRIADRGAEVERLEAEVAQDAANRDRFANLTRRENGGEELGEEDAAFLDAFSDKERKAKAQRADELEYRALVENDLSEEEKKELDALKAETKEYRIVAQRVAEARRRQLEWANQMAETSREAAEQAEREIAKDREERGHAISREDTLAAWDRAYGRQGPQGKLAMATAMEGAGRRQYDTADRILRMEDNGMRDEEGNRIDPKEIVDAIKSLGLELSKEEEAGIAAGQMDENLRARIERARNEGREDQRRGRQERWQAEDAARESETRFRLGQVKQGNRLTQMGLGGDVTGGWQKETADNTREMRKLGGRILRTLVGMKDTRRMFGTNGSTWAMR